MDQEEYREMVEATAKMNHENAIRYSKVMDDMETVWKKLDAWVDQMKEDSEKCEKKNE